MGDQYDLIVLDPPAFAKHSDALRNALQGYRKLNVKAFEKIKPGGILFHGIRFKVNKDWLSGIDSLLFLYPIPFCFSSSILLTFHFHFYALFIN